MRRIHLVNLVIVAILLTLGVMGCAGSAEETATPETIVDFVPVVSVTGEVLPEAWATLSAQADGTVQEIFVEQGDEVAAGDVLVRLDPTDAQLAVQQAQAALDNARAQRVLVEAAPRAEEIAAGEARLEAAEAALSQATAERNQLTAGTTGAEIAAAQAEVAESEAAHRAALIHYDEVHGEGADVKDWVKEEAALRLRAAEQAVKAAEMRLAQVTRSAGARTRGANAAVSAASAQRDVAQASLDLLQAGASAEEVAVAEAAVARAQAAVETASVALERCEIRAPFDGTVGAVDVRIGELVAPGQPLLTLGDLGTLRIETTDLDEIDVARVAVGQVATVTFDALPERVFNARVTRIAPMAEPGTGGVHFTAVVELDEAGADAGAIRWGMTAFVDIEVGR